MFQNTMEKLQKWFLKNQEKNLADFFTFLSFPSISTDPDYKEQMIDCANWVNTYCQKIGLASELVQTPTYPIVYAEKMANEKAPTVLIYGHYDVQPADPIELWKSDPFQAKMVDNTIYARGALDNKGQIFYVLLLMKALHELDISPDVNLKLCIEGEEESGSFGLSSILADEEKKQKFSCGSMLVVDFDILDKNTPAISLGARGIAPLDIELIGSATDLHSGFHGGIVYNPNRALIEILAKLWDEKGVIAIPNFYDDVEDLTKEEMSQFDFSFDEKAYKKAYGVKAFSPEGDRSVLETNWLRPSLELNGIIGGYTGEGFKTVIPRLAKAKLSCRLVPHQTPQKTAEKIRDFLQSHTPKGMELSVEIFHGGSAIRADANSHIAKCAMDAYSQVFQKSCKKIMSGGSVPVIADMVRSLQCEPVMMGMGLGEDNIHAPNEHFGWDRMEKGFLVIGKIIELMGGS